MKHNVRRVLEVTALLATSIALIATSRAPGPCAVETLNVRAVTTCGADTNLSLNSTISCGVVANGAEFGNLPATGNIDIRGEDAGLSSGFTLSSLDADAGTSVDCVGDAIDGGFALECRTTGTFADGGTTCSGFLTPQ
jgi:hypothetical protein